MAGFTLVTSLPKFGHAGATIARARAWNPSVFAAATPRPIQVNYSLVCERERDFIGMDLLCLFYIIIHVKRELDTNIWNKVLQILRKFYLSKRKILFNTKTSSYFQYEYFLLANHP